jgi:hypothetical protein
MLVGTHGAPQAAMGYPLTEWPSFLRKIGGHGAIVGFLAKDGAALGVGHRFSDYLSAGGQRLQLTLGPAYFVPYKAAHGLRSGSVQLFLLINLAPRGSPG